MMVITTNSSTTVKPSAVCPCGAVRRRGPPSRPKSPKLTIAWPSIRCSHSDVVLLRFERQFSHIGEVLPAIPIPACGIVHHLKASRHFGATQRTCPPANGAGRALPGVGTQGDNLPRPFFHRFARHVESAPMVLQADLLDMQAYKLSLPTCANEA